MEWSIDKVTVLIELYRTHPELWDVANNLYRNRNSRNEALQEISEMMDIERHEVEKKIKTLTTQFAREEKKILISKKFGGPIYEPKWFAYKPLIFIKESKSTGIDYEDSSSPRPEDPEPNPPITPSLVHELDTTMHLPKKRRIEPIEIYDEPVSISRQQQVNDEHDAYGITVAAKFRKMSEMQRLYAEHLMNEVMFKAMFKQLTPESYLVTQGYQHSSQYHDGSSTRQVGNMSRFANDGSAYYSPQEEKVIVSPNEFN